MRDHNKLSAFKLADELALMVYRITKTFPKEEIYGLTSQMRRAAVSVPSNIVEGCARETQVEYLRFLEIAFGSLRELKYQYDFAGRLNYIAESEIQKGKSKIDDTEKVLSALIRSLRKPRISP